MDVLRSCYTGLMRFTEGQPARAVKWFFASPSAQVFRGPTPFRSRNYEQTPDFNTGLGEQRPARYPWSNGIRSTGNDGANKVCSFPDAWWQEGIPFDAVISIDRTTGGVAVCCAAGPGGILLGGDAYVTPRGPGRRPGGILTNGESSKEFRLILGGIATGGEAEVIPHPPPGQMCCPGLAGDLIAQFPPGQGCPCLDGAAVTLTQVGNIWSGSAVVCADELLSIVLHCEGAGPDAWQVDVALENHGIIANWPVDPFATCEPFSLIFTGMEFPILGAECAGAIGFVINQA